MRLMKLSRSKLKALSTIGSNFSEVFLASLIIPVFTGEFTQSRLFLLVLGSILLLVSIYISLQFAEKGKL